jgi:hypothetical protein
MVRKPDLDTLRGEFQQTIDHRLVDFGSQLDRRFGDLQDQIGKLRPAPIHPINPRGGPIIGDKPKPDREPK